MEELIFIGLIVFFSILESIMRKKKGEGRPDGVPEPEPEAEDDWYAELPTYDGELSYDDRAGAGGGHALPEYQAPYAGPTEERGSESMVPADVWEEIAAIARGQAPGVPQPVPTPRADPVPVARPEHRIHRGHSEYGTDPSSRRPSEQDGLDPLKRTLSRDARAARRFLLDKDPHALRQAIILKEVLGPPVAMRDE